MLAVLKAGGAFVPLDPSHPVERLRGLCDSVGAKLLLCSHHHAESLEGVSDSVLPIDDDTIVNATQTGDTTLDMSASVTSSRNAAYVIFTSGSTGTPKVSAPDPAAA